MHQTGPSINTN